MNLTKSHLAVRHAANSDALGNRTDAVFFDIEKGKLRIVATDGHLLAILDTEAPAPAAPFLLSIDEANTLHTALAANGMLNVNEENAAIALGGFTYLGKPKFVDYRKVIRVPSSRLTEPIGFNYKLVKRAMRIIAESHPMETRDCIKWTFDGHEKGVHLTASVAPGELTIILMPMILP